MINVFLGKKRKNASFDSSFDVIEESKEKIMNYVYLTPIKLSSNFSYEKEIWNKEYKITNKKLKEFIIDKNYTSTVKEFKKPKNRNENHNKNNIIKDEKEYVSHCLGMHNYSIEQIHEINKIKKIPQKKFNLILDIDMTMIKSMDFNTTINHKKVTDRKIKITANNSTFQFFYRFRPYFFDFALNLKKYFNFYISTLSHKNYANEIISDFKNKTGINIISMSYRTDKTMDSKDHKYIDELFGLKSINEKNNTIIMDDTVYHWVKPDPGEKDIKDNTQNIKCLIPSKRYIMDNPEKSDKTSFSILIHNNIIEKGYNKNVNYLIDLDYSYCIEKDSIIKNNYKSGQLYYIELFLKKCIKLSLLSGTSLVNAMDYYRKKIFENCLFNLKFLDNKFHYPMISIIKDLGGKISISIDDSTHFIIENKLNSKKLFNKKNYQKYVTVNYIIQCYFNLYKLDELDQNYNRDIN